MKKNWLEEGLAQGYFVLGRGQDPYQSPRGLAGRAYITVTPRRLYATVRMELPYESPLSRAATMDDALKLAASYSSKGQATCGRYSLCVRDVPIARARELAGKLVEMAAQWKAAAEKAKER